MRWSPQVPLTAAAAASGAPLDVALPTDVYLNTAVADTRVVAVVELIIRERSPDGKLKPEVSAGAALGSGRSALLVAPLVPCIARQASDSSA